MHFHINDEKPSGKHRTIWIKIKNLKNIKLNALPIYDDRYIKTKTRTFGNTVFILIFAI